MRLKVDIIVENNTTAAQAARKSTTTIHATLPPEPIRLLVSNLRPFVSALLRLLEGHDENGARHCQ